MNDINIDTFKFLKHDMEALLQLGKYRFSETRNGGRRTLASKGIYIIYML